MKERKTTREFSTEKLPLQVLSNLLWAANGINRANGRRTAPSAMNMQEIDIYVIMQEGVYLYDAKQNTLNPVIAGDLREKTGRQPFVKDAPVNLIFVANLAKMSRLDAAGIDFYSAVDAGFVSQNVYLFCASEGLATVVRGSVDKPAFEKAMNFGKDKKTILAQTVGYPKNK